MSLFVELQQVSKMYPVGSSPTSELVAAMTSDAGHETVPSGKLAVDGLSLRIAEGDRLGIIGRNGAGKSTLLHMIAAICEPTTGAIRVNGKVTSIMTLGVGLRDDLSGRENIYVDGEIQGKSRAEVERVVAQVIEFAELGKFIDYPVRTYSTGMKARLAFAMISHVDPEILIIDEALAVGDASFSMKATERILEICARGKIVILVSHGMQSVREICNRCIYMKAGQIVMDGSPLDVTTAYLEEVRAEDEAALISRFRAHVGNRSHRAGSEIRRVSLLSGGEEIGSLRVEAQARLRIRLAGRHDHLTERALCRVRIVRIDDLVVFQDDFPLAHFSTARGKVGIELEFSPLALGASVYRLDAFFLDSAQNPSEPSCEHSTVFEVFTPAPPAGGKPMLYYPITAAVQT
ncbi:MAG: ABC transporter ATP-binding protein [Accumulibacter sp.]|jgi:lipopolysaccharide transport system ATP-binding protein